MTRKKIVFTTYEDARTVILDLLARQKEMERLQQEMNNILISCNLNRESNMSEPWTVKWACECVTTSIKDASKLFGECMHNNKQLALNIIKQNGYYGGHVDVKEMALDVLMDEPDMMYESIETNIEMNADRVEKLWNLYGERWFKEQSLAPVKLERLCRIFRKHIQQEHLELMVKRFVGRKMDDHAQRLLNDANMNLSQDLKDQLESCIMIKHLMKSNKNAL